MTHRFGPHGLGDYRQDGGLDKRLLVARGSDEHIGQGGAAHDRGWMEANLAAARRCDSDFGQQVSQRLEHGRLAPMKIRSPGFEQRILAIIKIARGACRFEMVQSATFIAMSKAAGSRSEKNAKVSMA